MIENVARLQQPARVTLKSGALCAVVEVLLNSIKGKCKSCRFMDSTMLIFANIFAFEKFLRCNNIHQNEFLLNNILHNIIVTFSPKILSKMA